MKPTSSPLCDFCLNYLVSTVNSVPALQGLLLSHSVSKYANFLKILLLIDVSSLALSTQRQCVLHMVTHRLCAQILKDSSNYLEEKIFYQLHNKSK